MRVKIDKLVEKNRFGSAILESLPFKNEIAWKLAKKEVEIVEPGKKLRDSQGNGTTEGKEFRTFLIAWT